MGAAVGGKAGGTALALVCASEARGTGFGWVGRLLPGRLALPGRSRIWTAATACWGRAELDGGYVEREVGVPLVVALEASATGVAKEDAGAEDAVEGLATWVRFDCGGPSGSASSSPDREAAGTEASSLCGAARRKGPGKAEPLSADSAGSRAASELGTAAGPGSTGERDRVLVAGCGQLVSALASAVALVSGASHGGLAVKLKGSEALLDSAACDEER